MDYKKIIGIIISCCTIFICFMMIRLPRIDVDTNIQVKIKSKEPTLEEIEKTIFQVQIAYFEKKKDIYNKIDKLKDEKLKGKEAFEVNASKLRVIITKCEELRFKHLDNLYKSVNESIIDILNYRNDLSDEQKSKLKREIFNELDSIERSSEYKKIIELMKYKKYNEALINLEKISKNSRVENFDKRILINNYKEFEPLIIEQSMENYSDKSEIENKLNFNDLILQSYEKVNINASNELKMAIAKQKEILSDKISNINEEEKIKELKEKEKRELEKKEIEKKENKIEDSNKIVIENNKPKEKYFKKVENKDDRTFAWVVAEEAVKTKLKSPSTAKFPFSSISKGVDIKSSGDIYVVESYVDAKNDFGAVIRSNFKVKFKRDGNSYILMEVKVN